MSPLSFMLNSCDRGMDLSNLGNAKSDGAYSKRRVPVFVFG